MLNIKVFEDLATVPDFIETRIASLEFLFGVTDRLYVVWVVSERRI